MDLDPVLCPALQVDPHGSTSTPMLFEAVQITPHLCLLKLPALVLRPVSQGESGVLLAAPVLQCLGNCAAAGSAAVVGPLQQPPCLQALSCCLGSSAPGLAQEAAWTLGNLAIGPGR